MERGVKGSIVFLSNPGNVQSASVLKDAMSVAQRLNYRCITPDLDFECSDEALLGALFIVSIGGDGTILKSVPLACRFDLPILGINLGRVGFMSEIAPHDFESALLRYTAGLLYEDERMMLSCFINGRLCGHCLNEALLYKTNFSGVAHMSFTIDGMDAGSVFCDGMIVGTPTGATGYSISAGGPVISPGLDAFVITPVCPHSLLARPIVASDQANVEFNMLSGGCLYIDGQMKAVLKKEDRVTLKRAEKNMRFLRMQKHNIYELIREKLI